MIKGASASFRRLALAAVTAATASRVGLAQESRVTALDDSVRRVVAELFTASRFTVDPPDPAFDTRRIRLEPFAGGLPACATLGAIRASDLSNSHSVKFIVATGGGTVFRLGGSASPDVTAFVSAVQRGSARMEVLGLSRCLARLLNPDASLEVVALGDSAASAKSPALDSVARQWLGDRVRSHFADIVVDRPDGSRWVRVSILTGVDGYGVVRWAWRSYAFHYDRAGELLQWHVRVDDRVPLP